MAVEKAKVSTAIETRFKGKNLTKTYKDKLATAWSAKIDTDDDIDGYIEDREDVILEHIAEVDRERQKAAATARKEAAKAAAGEAEPKEDDPAAPSVPEGTPDWAKALFAPLAAQMVTLTQTVNGFQQARTAETLTERFKKDERLKGIPEIMFKGRIPSKDEDYETAVEDLAADYKTFAETHKLTPAGAGLGKDNPPGGGSKTGSSDSVSAEIEAWGKANAPKTNS